MCPDDPTSTGATGGRRAGGTGAVCPECGEPVRPVPPTAPRPADEPEPVWSHLDGEPLCPVIGAHGYRPAHPRFTAAPVPDAD